MRCFLRTLQITYALLVMVCTFDSPECIPMHISINHKVIYRSCSPLYTNCMLTSWAYCLSSQMASAFASKAWLFYNANSNPISMFAIYLYLQYSLHVEYQHFEHLISVMYREMHLTLYQRIS